MKSQKGITLVSLTVYIIVMIIVVAMVTVISSYFYTDIKSVGKNINPLTEYTKFNSFFTEEVNHPNIKILECETNYIVFDNGVQYTFIPENQGIYRNRVKIAKEVESCTFEYKIVNGKDVVEINIKMQNIDLKNVEYTLKK